MSPAPGDGPGADAGDGPGAIAGRLAGFLARQLPGARDLRLEGLVRTSQGFSRENWVFDAAWTAPGGERVVEELILRRDPPGSVLDTDRAVEFAVLSALEGTGIPAPRARWVDATGEVFGRPSVIMDRVAGECDWFVLNGTRPLAARRRIATRFVDLLADLHRVDWRAGPLASVLTDPGPAAATVAVDHWEGQLRRHQLEPHPELELVATWLRDHAPASPETVLVHGDFKPGNALLAGDAIAAMLDWETAHLGDPHEDLGWITNPLRAREHQIPGTWERDQILGHYEARRGRPVDRDAVHWWNVLANYKLSVISLTGTAAFVDGRFDRLLQVPVALYSVMFDLIGV